jgi:hypothetical protein
MRLLPRTPRGTWTLAATTWLAGCAVAWSMIPPQPRIEWRDVPERFVVVDVQPEGPTIAMMLWRSCGMMSATEPILYLNVGTGERRDQLLSADHLQDLPAFSVCGDATASPPSGRRFQFDIEADRARCWDIATNVALWEVPLGALWQLPGDQQRLFTIGHGDEDHRAAVTVWDTRDGHQLGRMPFTPDRAILGRDGWVSPVAAVVALEESKPVNPITAWLEERLPWLGVRADHNRVMVVDVVTGRTLSVISGKDVHFLPDGGLVVRHGDAVQVWDIPPRKSFGWFAVVAAATALLITWLARWHARRLTLVRPSYGVRSGIVDRRHN